MSKVALRDDRSILKHQPQRRPQPALPRPLSFPFLSTAPAKVGLRIPIRGQQATTQRVALYVTILPSLLDQLLRAVSRACGNSLDILGIERLPRKDSIRVRLGMDGAGASLAMAAIIRTLPSGEIGRVSAF